MTKTRKTLFVLALCLVASLWNTRQDTDSADAHEDLDALLWMQTSAEYEAIVRQTFRLAQLNLGDALVDSRWTASVEQQSLYEGNPQALAKLPPAIVLDVDETVLDNTAYQASLIDSGEEFSRDSWKDFVLKEVSLAMPGAREFLETCRNAGVQVLFVTNREHAFEAATRQNLINAGLMREDDEDIIFTKYEQDAWKSDKTTRRQFLAERYRILLLLGDDLNDFVSPGDHPESQERKTVASQFESWWGHRWMMMPNPNYGGWERSVYDWKSSLSREAKLKLKRSRMRR